MWIISHYHTLRQIVFATDNKDQICIYYMNKSYRYAILLSYEITYFYHDFSFLFYSSLTSVNYLDIGKYE